MVIRLSAETVWLNGRCVSFPLHKGIGRAVECYASLAKHSPPQCFATSEKREKRKAPSARKALVHPLDGIASTIAWRLANPTNRAFMNRTIKRAKGSNGRKAIVKNDGKLYGFTPHDLSECDVEEIRGVCALVLAQAGNPETFDFATWKALFSESRKVLGMKRKVNRENLMDSLDTVNFHSELSLDGALIEALREEHNEEARREEERKAQIHGQARKLIRTILAARRADGSRKERSKMRTACRYLRAAIKCALGQGHAHELTRTAAYEAHAKFRAYIDCGKEQMAKEAEEANAFAQAEESARLMYGVGE